MFIEETREKLLKEIVRREVRAEQGVELEDLLNPIKVHRAPTTEATSGRSRALRPQVVSLTRAAAAGGEPGAQDPQARGGADLRIGRGAAAAGGGAVVEAGGPRGGEARRDARLAKGPLPRTGPPPPHTHPAPPRSAVPPRGAGARPLPCADWRAAVAERLRRAARRASDSRHETAAGTRRLALGRCSADGAGGRGWGAGGGVACGGGRAGVGRGAPGGARAHRGTVRCSHT